MNINILIQWHILRLGRLWRRKYSPLALVKRSSAVFPSYRLIFFSLQNLMCVFIHVLLLSFESVLWTVKKISGTLGSFTFQTYCWLRAKSLLAPIQCKSSRGEFFQSRNILNLSPTKPNLRSYTFATTTIWVCSWNVKNFAVRFTFEVYSGWLRAVWVKGWMSLRNGMWHGLRNDIIMWNVIYAEWPKEIN